MSTDIPPEFESFVSSLIEQRRFLSEREVLSEGLRLLKAKESLAVEIQRGFCLLYTSPSPRDQRGSRMPSSA